MTSAPKRSRKSSTVPKDETKGDKFIRLAKARVPKALKAVRNIGNLANKSGYEFDAHHVKKIIDALNAEQLALGERFKAALAGKPAATAEEFDI